MFFGIVKTVAQVAILVGGICSTILGTKGTIDAAKELQNNKASEPTPDQTETAK